MVATLQVFNSHICLVANELDSADIHFYYQNYRLSAGLLHLSRLKSLAFHSFLIIPFASHMEALRVWPCLLLQLHPFPMYFKNQQCRATSSTLNTEWGFTHSALTHAGADLTWLPTPHPPVNSHSSSFIRWLLFGKSFLEPQTDFNHSLPLCNSHCTD